MTTRLADKANVNAMIKAIEVSAKQNNVILDIKRDKETIKIQHKGKDKMDDCIKNKNEA